MVTLKLEWSRNSLIALFVKACATEVETAPISSLKFKKEFLNSLLNDY